MRREVIRSITAYCRSAALVTLQSAKHKLLLVEEDVGKLHIFELLRYVDFINLRFWGNL